MFKSIRRLISTRSDWAIDVHTHVYSPKYMRLMRDRSVLKAGVPYVKSHEGVDRLVILPDEDNDSTTSGGRPIGEEYYSVRRKIEFMDRHEIGVSVLSLANPWLDFMNAKDAKPFATSLNEELSEIHATSDKRLYGFGVLPLQDPAAAVDEVKRISKLPGIRGVIIGTSGRGKGLDDKDMDPVWHALSEHKMVTFIHPHYGLGNELYGGYGHSLFLALGFPFETSAAVARLILSGVLDRFPDLKLLLAHSGGTLPFLSGRLDSCVEGEPDLKDKLKMKPSEYLKKIYYDAVIYHTPAMKMVHELVGCDTMMFGTDHPFFPPKEGGLSNTRWPSTDKIHKGINGLDAKTARKVRCDNAKKLLRIE